MSRHNGLMLAVLSLNQHHWRHLRMCHKCRFSDFTPDLLSLELWGRAQESALCQGLPEILRKLKSEKHHSGGQRIPHLSLNQEVLRSQEEALLAEVLQVALQNWTIIQNRPDGLACSQGRGSEKVTINIQEKLGTLKYSYHGSLWFEKIAQKYLVDLSI